MTQSSDCAPGSASGGASIEIAGIRLAAQADPEPLSPGLLMKFAMSPGLAALIAEGVERMTGDWPASDADCRRGRWRRLINPTFRNARACVAFVERYHGLNDEGRR